jgi:hypothetical protein
MSVLAVGIVLGLSIPGNAQQPSKPSSGCNATTYNVHSMIADKDSTGNPFQIQSDGAGAYPNSSSDTTVSYVGGFTCQWYLDTTNSSRTIGLTFAYPASNGANPPFQQSQVHAKVFSRCPNSSGSDIDWTTMALNVANECGSTITFGYNGNSYNLSMNPNNAAGSTWIQVTCTGVNSSKNQCNMWSVTPPPISNGGVTDPYTGQLSAIGELIQSLRHGSQSLGFYYLAFSYTITNP